MKIDYDATIAKFKRGGSAKLEAAHELIISVYDYIAYLTKQYHSWLFYNHLEDVISHCHLYLLDCIHTFDFKQCRFITWSRQNILTALANYYGKYEKPVITSRGLRSGKIVTIYLGVPDNLTIKEYDNNKDYILIDKLKNMIINRFNEHEWDMCNDYCGFDSDPLSLHELSIKYGYNSRQAVHLHIVKVRNYLKTKLSELI